VSFGGTRAGDHLTFFSTRTAENVPLFYDVQNKSLKLYDVTSKSPQFLQVASLTQFVELTPPAFCAMASLNPNLTSLCLEYCGCIEDTAINAWCTSTPNLTRLELLGPFLVRPPAWKAFFESHPKLEGFLITQSPRFDVECTESLISNCPGLKELRLKEVGLMSDEIVEVIGTAKGGLTHLDLAYPGKPDAVSEAALIDLMKQVGSTLLHLNLSGNKNLTDTFLTDGIRTHARVLETLKLANLVLLTDEGVAQFFTTWSRSKKNPPLECIDLSRNHELSTTALDALLLHSGPRLEVLNINAWKATSQEALMGIPKHAPKLVKADLGFCREIDDFIIKALMEECKRLKEIKCWGCHLVTGAFPRKVCCFGALYDDALTFALRKV
jgi:DNA repair protein RAD7